MLPKTDATDVISKPSVRKTEKMLLDLAPIAFRIPTSPIFFKYWPSDRIV